MVWTDDCETSFQDMKAALTKTPVLCFPDTRKEFILNTDASFEAIGAVLSQEDDNGRERVVAYGSRKRILRDEERVAGDLFFLQPF